MHVSEDKRVATVEVHGTYRADEMEKLIEELCVLRAQMLPAVPMSPTRAGS